MDYHNCAASYLQPKLVHHLFFSYIHLKFPNKLMVYE
nr:MAG TPA: hypothetical protein [Bacteriophage sp.]